MLELVRLVGDLQPKAEAAAMWQARAEVLAERLASAESRLLALAAPEASQATTAGQETVSEPSAIRWRAGAISGVVGLVVLLAIVAAWLLTR
jgi:hypothetical protein